MHTTLCIYLGVTSQSLGPFRILFKAIGKDNPEPSKDVNLTPEFPRNPDFPRDSTTAPPVNNLGILGLKSLVALSILTLNRL